MGAAAKVLIVDEPVARVALRVGLAIVGTGVYAAAGGVMGAQNADWLGAPRESNALLPFLGVGVALAVAALAGSPFHRSLRRTPLGKVGGRVVSLGAVLYVVSWAVEFAIFGTLTVALGLALLAVAFWRERIGQIGDRVVVTLAAIGSLTWNTETTSAFLLVGVGVGWMAIAVRMLTRRRPSSGVPR